jgi:hypothetical protein
MPDDTSPHGGEAMHPPPDRAKIPEPRPDAASRHEELRPDAGDIAERPPLPAQSHPLPSRASNDDRMGPRTGADDTGKPSVTRQPGEE